ncbi:protease [Hyalangium versicolor]|uniref:protease n=1 Tax=Hyalangium versicolor TaxID=2861190 RepID=UPI001CCAD32F|nr:protease [Hyalangium versicolor]
MTAAQETDATKPGGSLKCELSAPPSVKAGEPVVLTFRITNSTAETLYVLKWRSPFEGEPRSKFLEITRDGAEVLYQGPMIKRGNPSVNDYATVAAGTTAEIKVEASLAYDFSQPGNYRIAYGGPLMDATTQQAEVPRPLDQHRSVPFQCPEVQLTVTAP